MLSQADRQRIEAVRRFYTDEAPAAAPDIVWHVPGHNPVSGTYRGWKAYFEVMPERMAPLDLWDVKVVDVMVNGDFVTATFRVLGRRRGIEIDLPGVHLFRVTDDFKIAEGWGFVAHQDFLDEFFNA
jgi:ketosteroid isomerase-like protein